MCYSQKQKQPKCLLTDEQTHKVWYIHTMAYYPVTTRNEVLYLLQYEHWKFYAK